MPIQPMIFNPVAQIVKIQKPSNRLTYVLISDQRSTALNPLIEANNQPPTLPPLPSMASTRSTLEETEFPFEQWTDSLGDLASLFVCSVFQFETPVSGPYGFRKYTFDNFVIQILRYMKLDDDVLFGALMFIHRIRFRSRRFIFKTHFKHKIFISAYILSAKQITRERGETVSPSVGDYVKWSIASQGLFNADKIRNMERATLRVLQEDRNKGLQADNSFDGLLPRFRSLIVDDYEVKWEFPSYPQSLATIRPVFMIHDSDEEE